MNAYELADLIETTETINNTTATMLRQQADRIAELEKYLKKEIDMDWENQSDKPDYWLGYGLQAYTEKPHDEATPLYTRPSKQLSDEEIEKIENKIYLKTTAKGKPLGEYAEGLIRETIKEMNK